MNICKIMLAILSFSLMNFSSSFAAENTATVDSKPGSSAKTHNFEDLLIQGKYHFSDEAVTTVEADKVFDSLIGVRSDFKDRLEQSATKQ